MFIASCGHEARQGDKLIPKIISKAEKVSKLNHVFKTDIP